jgi:hypothetical protein
MFCKKNVLAIFLSLNVSQAVDNASISTPEPPVAEQFERNERFLSATDDAIRRHCGEKPEPIQEHLLLPVQDGFRRAYPVKLMEYNRCANGVKHGRSQLGQLR